MTDSPKGEDVFGPWSVMWGAQGCQIRPLGDFPYAKIKLPIEIIPANDRRQTGYAIVTLDPDFRVAVLLGAKVFELERFAEMISKRVVAMTKGIC